MTNSTFFLALSFFIFSFFLFFYIRRPVLRFLDSSINSIKEELRTLEEKKNILQAQLEQSQAGITNINTTLGHLKAEMEALIQEQEISFLAKKDKIKVLYDKKMENEIAKIETYFIEEISTLLSTKLILALKEIALKEKANELLIDRLKELIKNK